jgi:ATP-dependent Zn protease
MKFLIDHNLRGHAVVLLGSLTASGWLDLISIRFVLFEEVGLAINSDDRAASKFMGGSNRRSISEESAQQIDNQVKGMIDSAYATAKQILESNQDLLESISGQLLDREVLEGGKLEGLLPQAQYVA